MDMTEDDKQEKNGLSWMLPTPDLTKEYWVSGRLVYLRDKGAGAPSGPQLQTTAPQHRKPSHDPEHKLLGFPMVHDFPILPRRTDLEDPPRILTLAELARQAIEGL